MLCDVLHLAVLQFVDVVLPEPSVDQAIPVLLRSPSRVKKEELNDFKIRHGIALKRLFRPAYVFPSRLRPLKSRESWRRSLSKQKVSIWNSDGHPWTVEPSGKMMWNRKEASVWEIFVLFFFTFFRILMFP